MSLTGLFKEKGSLLTALFKSSLPETRRFVMKLNREIGESPLVTSKPTDPGLSGVAVDYRLRYYFGAPTITSLVAWTGAQRMESMLTSNTPLSDTLLPFLKELDTSVRRLQPVGRRLASAEEMQLDRACIVLAYFEQFYRSLRSIIFERAVGGSLRTASEILQLPPTDVIADVAAMSWAFFDHQFPLLVPRVTVLNPVFAGSVHVGGADADIIAGGSLIEFKSSAKESPLLGTDIYQLLGYACLDFPDQFGIRAVGFSIVRRNFLKEWGIDELVALLSDERTNYRTLRERVKSFVGGPQ